MFFVILIHELWRIAVSLLVSLQAVFKKINIKDVSFPQILAISIIEPQGIDMSTISERMGIDNSTATRLIIGLEKKDG